MTVNGLHEPDIRITHIIMYDLPSDTPQEVRLALIKKIKSLGLYTRPLISTWTISTQYLCQDILNILLPMITYGGKIYITDIHTGEIRTSGITDSDLALKPKEISSPLLKLGVPLKKVSPKFNLFDGILSK